GPNKGAAWWLSGAEFGIEGSAAATAALAGLAVWSFFYFKRTAAKKQAAVTAGELA
ncbi:MAG: CPBP family intramembrane metalloprotease, partial [Coriobacteriia bacterium]|nr:CPBP family intramembrane metalloprotease [Coriobacteriia bacterium]